MRYEDILDKELFNIRMEEPKNTIEGRCCILTYELGNAVKSIYYSRRFPSDKDLHLANAKLELSDLITQIHMLCQELGFNFHELRNLGLEHVKERYKEFKENNWKDIDQME